MDGTTDSARPRVPLVKARVVGEGVASPTRAIGGDGSAGVFAELGVLDPPYDLDAMAELVEHSAALRQNLDAYAVNVDGFGHRLEPVIDLTAEDARDVVADAIVLERLDDDPELDVEAVAEPSAADVDARIQTFKRRARVERARARAFFGACCSEHSFTELRMRTRRDMELVGNGYWEVLRDRAGRIARLVHVAGHTVRLLPLAAQDTRLVEERVAVSVMRDRPLPVPRQLRRFVQVDQGQRVFFKSFGDPGFVSRRTGVRYDTVEALTAADAEDAPANELLHFRVHSSRTPYGVPRWVGTALAIQGSRAAEEVNWAYFGNKSVPPLAILVSGGQLTESSVPRIERFIEEHLKGKKNFHKILVLEADAAGDSKAKIEMKPLTAAQQQDALFQTYDERNIDKVGATFRLPRLLRGDGRDYNRATAEAALRFTEDQVFQPLREEFDDTMNRLLREMGITCWRFASQAPIARDPERLSGMVEKLVRVGVLTPAEGRALAEDVFNRPLQVLSDEWTKRPLTLTMADIQNRRTAC